ncbi:uncharacterized protein BDZ99DRAFT_549598 [Mytilinidion resinicola]|uniref:Uncharacterized protein n=1 Tax=Mytilinidion resinicola TaxID=574789 RepID=A0A6A6Z1S6_9PEZI|nr:uncharacterized protein BDZ99DRAFT_549598 [Mytilinidion resinicola]KAF2815106.1 hypothetical protein BDZ99DRAFT_549598 [Mytilinidion resinicola]
MTCRWGRRGEMAEWCSGKALRPALPRVYLLDELGGHMGMRSRGTGCQRPRVAGGAVAGCPSGLDVEDAGGLGLATRETPSATDDDLLEGCAMVPGSLADRPIIKPRRASIAAKDPRLKRRFGRHLWTGVQLSLSPGCFPSNVNHGRAKSGKDRSPCFQLVTGFPNLAPREGSRSSGKGQTSGPLIRPADSARMRRGVDDRLYHFADIRYSGIPIRECCASNVSCLDATAPLSPYAARICPNYRLDERSACFPGARDQQPLAPGCESISLWQFRGAGARQLVTKAFEIKCSSDQK